MCYPGNWYFVAQWLAYSHPCQRFRRYTPQHPLTGTGDNLSAAGESYYIPTPCYSVAGHRLSAAGHKLSVAGQCYEIEISYYSAAGYNLSAAGYKSSATGKCYEIAVPCYSAGGYKMSVRGDKLSVAGNRRLGAPVGVWRTIYSAGAGDRSQNMPCRRGYAVEEVALLCPLAGRGRHTRLLHPLELRQQVIRRRQQTASMPHSSIHETLESCLSARSTGRGKKLRNG